MYDTCATYGPLNIISSPRVLCTLRYPWWPPWRGNHHLQAQGVQWVQQQKPRSFGVRNEANELGENPETSNGWFKWKFPFWGQQKAYFQRLFAVSFREFFFPCLKPHTLAEEYLFLQHISSAITRRLLVHQFQALLEIFGELFGCLFWNETYGSKIGAVPNNNGEILESTDHHAKITLFGVQNNQVQNWKAEKCSISVYSILASETIITRWCRVNFKTPKTPSTFLYIWGIRISRKL